MGAASNAKTKQNLIIFEPDPSAFEFILSPFSLCRNSVEIEITGNAIDGEQKRRVYSVDWLPYCVDEKREKPK